jgi:hypothetical protein
MKLSFILCLVFALIACANAAWTADHYITGEASKQLAQGIKQKMYDIIHSASTTKSFL